MALAHVQQFLRLMGQPIDQKALQSVLLTVEEAKMMNPKNPKTANTVGNIDDSI